MNLTPDVVLAVVAAIMLIVMLVGAFSIDAAEGATKRKARQMTRAEFLEYREQFRQEPPTHGGTLN